MTSLAEVIFLFLIFGLEVIVPLWLRTHLLGPPQILICGESAAQGENVLQGLCPQSHEP